MLNALARVLIREESTFLKFDGSVFVGFMAEDVCLGV
jgi:hypothetical protein